MTEATTRSAPPMSARTAVLLQRQAGNRATAQLIARQRRASAPPPAPGHQRAAAPAQDSATAGPATASVDGGAAVQRLVAGRAGPGQDAKFAALKGDVRAKQKGLAAHPPAQSEAKAAQGAAKPPPDDKEAQGKTANAEKMNAAKPGEFDKAAFVKAVNDAIAKQAPKNLDEADKFGDSGKANAVKGEVQGKVGTSKDAAAKAINTTTKAPPDTAAAKGKPVTPLQPDKPPPTPGAPNPDQAVPDKAPPAATDFSEGPKQVDKQMTDAQVTEEQLAKSNEPEFSGALKEKKAGEAHAATAPGEVRASEAKTLSGAKAAAAQTGAAAMTTMTAHRAKAGQQVSAGKEGAKGSDESKRAQVNAKLQKVFDATKTDVEQILTGLDRKVDDEFSKGEKAARDAFTADYTAKINKYKDDRYGGMFGWTKWIKDKFAGLPSEVNAFYEQARQGYVNQMQGVISSVADVIGAELTRAKQRIATGRTELQAEVKKLDPDLQAIGKQAAGEFEGKFDELTQSVNDKGTQLVDTLASKYTEALKAVDEQIDTEKEKNKGLIAKAVDAVKGVIDTILKLKDLLLGVLAKAAQAVVAIIKDPIGFLGHVVSAVGAGLKAFMANIATHLQKGLVSWLLGAAAKAGLQLPAKFDLKGVLMLIASLLGLTWAAIRGRVVQRGVPEQAMGAVESSVPIAQKIQNEGIGGIWEDIKEKVGDLKENLLGKITEYLIPTVLIAGITWIISLLNPASAFIKACKAIIDIVTFIVDRGAQIMAFVNAVLDAIIAIAAGGAGGVPALIETALATAIPVLIGFLAALLGIGGLADKVKKFFQALSKPVMKAVDWVVGKIVAFGKRIWAKLKAAGKKVKDKFSKKNAEKKPDDKSKDPNAFPSVEVSFAMHGAGHRVIANAPGKLVMASREQLLLDKINNVIIRYEADMERRPAKASVPAEIARMELLHAIQAQANLVLDLTQRSAGAKAKGSYELEQLLRQESGKLTPLLARYGDQYNSRDLAFDPGFPTFPGSEQVKAVIEKRVGEENTVKDAMWNLASPGNEDIITYITSKRFEQRDCENVQDLYRKLASVSMVPSVRMAFQEAEKLLNKGAKIIFEPKVEGVEGADVDLALIKSGRLVVVYQYKHMSIGNLKGELDHATGQVRGLTEAAQRIVYLRLHDVTRLQLGTDPKYREKRQQIIDYRARYPTVTYRIRCSDEP
ncbi:MAG: hypothetical protein ACRDTX_22450 [Pseudonocardiaceae bacterium]